MAQSVDLSLKEVDRVEITTLIDNYVDLMLQDTPIVKRPPLSYGLELPKDTFVAEHGLSLLITTYSGTERHSVLFDAGYNENGVMHNIDQLGVDIQSVEALVLSHAHMDHAGALHAILNRISKPIPFIVHPDILPFGDETRIRFHLVRGHHRAGGRNGCYNSACRCQCFCDQGNCSGNTAGSDIQRYSAFSARPYSLYNYPDGVSPDRDIFAQPCYLLK